MQTKISLFSVFAYSKGVIESLRFANRDLNAAESQQMALQHGGAGSIL